MTQLVEEDRNKNTGNPDQQARDAEDAEQVPADDAGTEPEEGMDADVDAEHPPPQVIRCFLDREEHGEGPRSRCVLSWIVETPGGNSKSSSSRPRNCIA